MLPKARTGLNWGLSQPELGALLGTHRNAWGGGCSPAWVWAERGSQEGKLGQPAPCALCAVFQGSTVQMNYLSSGASESACEPEAVRVDRLREQRGMLQVRHGLWCNPGQYPPLLPPTLAVAG